MAQGKTVKILCVGKKGFDILRRKFERQIIELIEFRSVRSLGFEQADLVGEKIRELYASAASSTSARCSTRPSAR